MIENNLIRSAVFSPKLIVSPSYWVGHLPFAHFVIQETNPKIFVELGTHSGNSYFSCCQAVQDNDLSTQCYAVDTWQGDEHVGQYGEDVFKHVNAHNQMHYNSFSQLLRMTFDDALNCFADGSINLLHIDGLHFYDAVRHDFETWLPKLAPGGVIMFHDTNIRDHDFGVWKLWGELQAVYPHHLEFFHSCGLGVLQLNNPPDDKKISWLTNDPLKQNPMVAYFSALGLQQLNNYTIRTLESEVYNLNQTVTQKNLQITEHQGLMIAFRNEIYAYRSSRSWQITQPLRKLSQLKPRLIQLLCFYQNYRQKYLGTTGFIRLVRKGVHALRTKGIKALCSTIYMNEHAPIPTSYNVLQLEDLVAENINLPKDIAVHAHIFYTEHADEVRYYLNNIPVKFHLYVTTDTLEKAALIKNTFINLDNMLILDIVISKNQGRDIFPMLITLGNKLVQHDVVLHIHTKRSPHHSWQLGGWRRYMMESLLGNSQRVAGILQQFGQNETLGILFPDPYHPIKPFIYMKSNSNDHNIQKLLKLAGKHKTEINHLDRTFFPAGDMFWFRGKAIQSFIEMGLSAHDFEPEKGQFDGTLAHAIERMFPYFATEQGMITQSYYLSTLLSPECNAHPIHLFHRYIKNKWIHSPILLFDHNSGGGANKYSHKLITKLHANGLSILRIYNAQGIWLAHWIGDYDGMLFYTADAEELFNTLTISRSTRIIVNSLYGHPDINSSISNIIKLTNAIDATLNIKIHDFHALCQSPHLLDFKGNYCGVPQDPRACDVCLKNNHVWYHNWYPEENKAIDITEWRRPFATLLTAADTITFFDPSSIEVMQKAFDLDLSKIEITPHTVDLFQYNTHIDLSAQLHIGILGTLNKTKGSDVVNVLSDHIKTQGMHIPITLVGSSTEKIHSEIMVHGQYEEKDLSLIIGKHGINVIFMSSIIPETFSYTISEAMQMGLPIVAFDLGAQGSRVKQYKLGKIIPIGSSPDVILTAIQSILQFAQEQTQ